MELDHTDPPISCRRKPQLIKQGDHLAAGRHRAPGRRPARSLSLADLRPSRQLLTPHPAGLNGVNTWLRTSPLDVRGQSGRQSRILPIALVGADLARCTVKPGRTPATLHIRSCPDHQSGSQQLVQMLTNRVGVLTDQRRQRDNGAGLRLVDQDIQDACPGGRETRPPAAHLWRRQRPIPRPRPHIRPRIGFHGKYCIKLAHG